jgi:hypothetical protein
MPMIPVKSIESLRGRAGSVVLNGVFLAVSKSERTFWRAWSTVEPSTHLPESTQDLA